MKLKLPIDVIPNVKPVRFKWCQIVDTVIGMRDIEHEGSFSPSVESALIETINLIKQQHQEIIGLRRQIDSMTDRIAAQSELLSKKAEVQTTTQTLQQSSPVVPLKKK